jgi:membrane protein
MATAAKTRRRRANRSRVSRARLPALFRQLVRAFREHNLLTFAGALSFQVITAIVPFLLFGLGLLAFFSFQHAWSQDIAPQIKPHLSQAAFTVVNDSVNKVLGQKQLFWVTAGFALAMWEISGGIRTIMGVLDMVYESTDRRSFWQRMRVSLLLALVVSALVLAAIALVWLAPLAYGNVGAVAGVVLAIVRWAIAAGLLAVAVGLTIRYAPDAKQPVGWVSFGTLLTVGAWVVASLLFGFYVRVIASYGSIFGQLATVVVLMAYVYISSIVFFAGVQVDAIIRRRVEGNAQGR